MGVVFWKRSILMTPHVGAPPQMQVKFGGCPIKSYDIRILGVALSLLLSSSSVGVQYLSGSMGHQRFSFNVNIPQLVSASHNCHQGILEVCLENRSQLCHTILGCLNWKRTAYSYYVPCSKTKMMSTYDITVPRIPDDPDPTGCFRTSNTSN